MIAEILLTPVAQPDSQDLRNLVFLLFREPLIELQGPLALHATGAVPVRVPVSPGKADATCRLFDKSRAR